MLNGNHNFDSDYGIELLSYMYGELEPKTRAEFESHLSTCEECAFELASFADARLGMIEWKRQDFDHLASPVITIPEAAPRYILTSGRAATTGIAGFWGSILSSPLFARVGPGLAAAAFIAGLVYFVNIGSTTHPLAVENGIKPAAAEVGQIKDQISQMVQAQIAENSDDGKQNSPVPENKVKPHRPATKRIQLASIRTSRQTSNLKITALRVQPVTKKVPRLNNFDDDEDKTLRLSDLLADIGNSDDK